MGKALLWAITLAAVLAPTIGCSSPSAWMPSFSMLPGWMGGSKPQTGLALTGGSEFNKSYEDLRAENQARKVVAPALGYDAEPEPGMMKKLGTAVAGSGMVKAAKSAYQTSTGAVTKLVTPTTKKALDPISISAGSAPADANLFLATARMQEASGDLAAAELQYRKVVESDPKNLAALLGCARVLDRQDRLAEAALWYRKAVEFHPQHAAAQNDLGLCYARQGLLSESVAALEQAVRLQPNRKLYRNNIATVLVEMGRPADAFSHLATAHGEAVAHYNVGYLLHERGDAAGATRQFSLALESDPSLDAARAWIETLRGADQGVTAPRGDSPNGPAISAVHGDPTRSSATPASQTPPGRPAMSVGSPAPVNLPHWAESSDHGPRAAVPPSPGDVGGYATAAPDRALSAPSASDLLRHLPPVDPAHRPPSRY